MSEEKKCVKAYFDSFSNRKSINFCYFARGYAIAKGFAEVDNFIRSALDIFLDFNYRDTGKQF